MPIIQQELSNQIEGCGKMFYENVLKDQRILIRREEDKEVLADTKIIRYDILNNSVTISADSLVKKELSNVSILIFGVKKLYEFHGTIKGSMVENEIEVLLGRRKVKEDRKKPRYRIRMKGHVNAIQIEKEMIRLRKPIEIKTLNMSSNGILMKTDAGSFYIGTCFSLSMIIDQKELEFDCEVVRIQNSKTRTEEYGCKVTEVRLV